MHPDHGWLARYTRWLHTRWPAGTVEPLPEAATDGSTSLPGVYIAGDLTGIPLLKFSLDSGARVARRIAESLASRDRAAADEVLDLAIVGAGVSGMAAAAEARSLGLRLEIVEAAEPFFTLVNFPKAKPIYTFPTGMRPAGPIQVGAKVKEALIEELRAQTDRAGIRVRRAEADKVELEPWAKQPEGSSERLLRVHLADGGFLRARRVLLAMGRSGDFRRLDVPGEDRDKVYNRLHDPADFRGRRVLVVGGGDSALETAIALTRSGAQVILSYRGAELSRAKAENVEQLQALTRDPGPGGGTLELRLGTRVREIGASEALLVDGAGAPDRIPNDVVFTMIGRRAPLNFFRRSGIRIAGHRRPASMIAMASFLVFAAWLYNWKSGGAMSALFERHGWFPFNLAQLLSDAGSSVARAAADPRTLLGTLAISAAGPAFWYTVAYSAVVVVFGIRRIRRRRMPYVTAQTLTLMAVQVVPLFLLPELILPLLGHRGLLHGAWVDGLFPRCGYGHGREYWRAYGLILAWPLDVYNIFTQRPLWAWIGIGIAQTLVLIPLGIYFFGKGIYCGWICSCGALAETLGDTQRHKMPHGPRWNRLNMAGQAVLAVAVALLAVRIAGWALPPGNWADRIFEPVLATSYKWMVDVFLAGVVGYGLYFWFSGRVWCRFLCPLAALMHIYTRLFSRFAIVPDKKRCISCNVCTSVCHQGIDVMSFANKGVPMTDPECVRCSACVHSCPTGVLQFGQVGRRGNLISLDSLCASPVLQREGASPGLRAGESA